MLRSSSTSRLPDPVGSFPLFVAIRKSTVYNFLQIADSQPHALVGRFIDPELYLVLEGVERRLHDSDVVAV